MNWSRQPKKAHLCRLRATGLANELFAERWALDRRFTAAMNAERTLHSTVGQAGHNIPRDPKMLKVGRAKDVTEASESSSGRRIMSEWQKTRRNFLKTAAGLTAGTALVQPRSWAHIGKPPAHAKLALRAPQLQQ